MAKFIWFGTREYARWIPAPSISGYSAASVGWSARSNYLNGRAGVRRSVGSHREYVMNWSNKPQADLLPVIDFAERLYGDGLLHWVDPFASVTNVLPKDWATPVRATEGKDGLDISGGAARPVAVATPANTMGFPVQSALITGAPAALRSTILVPPGHDLVLTSFGAAVSGTLRMVASDRGAAATTIPLNAVDNASPATIRIAGGPLGTWVEVYLSATGSTSSATITAVMGRIVRSGGSVSFSRFFSGQGNAGCDFDPIPALSPYSAPLDMVSLSANLVEVGP